MLSYLITCHSEHYQQGIYPASHHLLTLSLYFILLQSCIAIFIIQHPVGMKFVGQKMLTLYGTPDFTPFGEFMTSPIHYKYIT